MVEWEGDHWFPAPTRLDATQAQTLSRVLQGAAPADCDQTTVRELGCSLILTPP